MTLKDSHIPSFIPKMVEGEKIISDVLVPSLPAPPSPPGPINDDHRVESPYYFLYVE